MIIDDGRGKGYSAQVDSENRLATQALTETQVVHHAHEGVVYLFNTGIIALTTTASYSGIWYVKNESADKNLYIDRINFSAGQNSNWRIIKGPSTGTLITGGTARIPVVTKFDSGNSFDGTFMYGADASTITDGELLDSYAGVQQVDFDYDGMVILTPNTTMAIEVKPSSACDVNIGIVGFVTTTHGH